MSQSSIHRLSRTRVSSPMLLAAGLLAWAALASAAGGLNDTGITGCVNATQNNLPCPQPGYPSQDAETGRDAQPDLPKVGAGPAGFDYTKLDSSGQPLPGSATHWDCVRDNVTGLIWEIKTNDNGLRDKDWTYTWCNTDAATNGGSAGVCDTGAGVGGDNCFNQARCDTEHYASDVNALPAPLCGHADWRMPTREELRSIVDYSAKDPAIATAYFPRTVSYYYWSASPYVGAGNAWIVFFSYGGDNADESGYSLAVRLVRGGQ